VLIPADNAKDLVEIPDNIKQNLEIKPVHWIDEVLEVALQYTPVPVTQKDIEEQGKNEADLIKIKNQTLMAH
jgi:ATP-dependent Lon protease